MSDELIVVDAISTGKKKVPSCMLCRLTNSRGQHRHDVMHEVGHGVVGVTMFYKNKEGMSTVIFFESVQGIVSLRCKVVSVHLGETFRGKVFIVCLVLKL